MISLTLNLLEDWTFESQVVRVLLHKAPMQNEILLQQHGQLSDFTGKNIGKIREDITDVEDNEIWIFFANTKKVQRFYRPSSNSNTILLTERCDQACIMCSQPPKNKDYLYFDIYKQALGLIDAEVEIGISGGEPSLFKTELLEFLIQTAELYPNIKFQILTNGQHFNVEDKNKLKRLSKTVMWAVPIYSANPEQHDKIVGKDGAFDTLMQVLPIFAVSSSHVQIRSVVMQQNYFDFPELAKLLSIHLPWISHWAIMQLERYGFARIQWANKFIDTGSDFDMIANALDITASTGLRTKLFNFPKCTVPKNYRHLAINSISDWKQKYLQICSSCNSKNDCSGFFEWYRENSGYSNLVPI